MLRVLNLVAACLATPAAACQTALLLAVDESGSVDPAEYHLQTTGLADALETPDITAALVQGQVALMLMHWSGVGHQRITIDWARMTSPADVAAFAAAARALQRPHDYSDTAIGDAILFSLNQFPRVDDCRQHVIDISGDGRENASRSLPDARSRAEAEGVTVNGIAIEINETSQDLSQYYRQRVITRGGFVETAQGTADYPRAIEEKLLRELTKPVS